MRLKTLFRTVFVLLPFIGFTTSVAAASDTIEMRMERLSYSVYTGELLTERDLQGLECLDVWLLSNTVLARIGYMFEYNSFEYDFFSYDALYVPDTSVGYDNYNDSLSATDEQNLNLFLATETELCEGGQITLANPPPEPEPKNEIVVIGAILDVGGSTDEEAYTHSNWDDVEIQVTEPSTVEVEPPTKEPTASQTIEGNGIVSPSAFVGVVIADLGDEEESSQDVPDPGSPEHIEREVREESKPCPECPVCYNDACMVDVDRLTSEVEDLESSMRVLTEEIVRVMVERDAALARVAEFEVEQVSYQHKLAYAWTLGDVADGLEVNTRHMAAFSCQELWVLERVPLARHGYTFPDDPRAVEHFAGELWYEPVPELTLEQVQRAMRAADSLNSRRAVRTANEKGCTT